LKKKGSIIQIVCQKLEKELKYLKNETDMVFMYHSMTVQFENKKKIYTSTLSLNGEVNGFSATSKTVGYPVSLATMLILEGKVKLTGVLAPVYPEIYLPVLESLKTYGIDLQEEIKDIIE
jgi:saccharopine dehydrogenase-like NADP-dependent oxidoreductase